MVKNLRSASVVPILLAWSVSVQLQTTETDSLRLRAEQGDPIAQFEIGELYDTGEGVSRSLATAAEWYRLAAEQEHVRAQINLGRMYDTGEGVPQNYVLAHMWLNLAASRGVGDVGRNAVRLRTIITTRMTSEQIGEAQRLAREWRPAQVRDRN